MITVKEKEHWKERIARRIDKAIKKLVAEKDQHFFTKHKKMSKEKAVQFLGFTMQLKAIDEIEAQCKKLSKRREDTWSEMAELIGASDTNSRYGDRNAVENEIAKWTKHFEKELLSETELGCQIERLENEKEELLDTVWLATSPKQIRDLWQRFAELTDWEPPAIQKEAITSVESPDSQ